MSHIGRKLVKIPKSLNVTFNDHKIILNGLLDSKELNIPNGISYQYIEESNHYEVIFKLEDQKLKKNWGSIRSQLKNTIEILQVGVVANLRLKGIGFRATIEKDKILFKLGFADDIEINIPAGFKVYSNHYTELDIFAPNKKELIKFVDYLRRKRPPEPYKGKGVLFLNEQILRKEGKKN
jgi:large subunit ribosomal protein L6